MSQSASCPSLPLSQPESPSSQPLRALICDDESSIRKLFAMLLEASGFQVQTAIDGLDALRQINCKPETRFDVIITDNNMPRLDGVGLVRALRALDYEGKIVVVSGFLEEESLAAYRLLGVDRIITKIQALKDLEIVLNECLQA